MNASTGRGKHCLEIILTISAPSWSSIFMVVLNQNWQCQNRKDSGCFRRQLITSRLLSPALRLTSRLEDGDRMDMAYNQARRHPYHHPTLAEIADSTIRIQENNLDTIIALAHRSFGAGYQFVPPMSVTLGMRECLSAKKVRVYSDTGAWKQTALRVALFSEVTPEYPITLLQRHPDAVITATVETANHPIAENPDWELF